MTDLVRLAAAGPGALLIVDDVHEADESSLRLLHYLARSCATDRLMLVLAHRRQPVTAAFEDIRASLLGRGGAVELPVVSLDRSATGAPSPATRTVLEHVAVAGTAFDTDEFLALSGQPQDAAFDCLDAALAALVVERARAGRASPTAACTAR